MLFKKRKKKQTVEPVQTYYNPYNDLIEWMAKTSASNDEARDQEQLDFQKWIESEKAMRDKSGDMKYCSLCDFSINKQCIVEPKDRVAGRLCAKACKKYIENFQHERAKNFQFTKIDDDHSPGNN